MVIANCTARRQEYDFSHQRADDHAPNGEFEIDHQPDRASDGHQQLADVDGSHRFHAALSSQDRLRQQADPTDGRRRQAQSKQIGRVCIARKDSSNGCCEEAGNQ
jgi:hypothetical protein